MNALTSLDGLAEDTDIAVRMTAGAAVERWRVAADGGLLRGGKRLDAWFLSGLLAEGRVYHGDFEPAQPGEWFTKGQGLLVLVVAVAGSAATQVAQFRLGEFQRWSAETDLIEQGLQRCERPEWSGTGDAFFKMTCLAWRQEQQAAEMRLKAHNMARARDYMRYVVEYANNVQGLIQ